MLFRSAKKQVGIHSDGDEIMLKSAKKTSVKSDEEIVLDAASNITLDAEENVLDAEKNSLKAGGSGNHLQSDGGGNFLTGTSNHAKADGNFSTPPFVPGAAPAEPGTADSASDASTDTKQSAAPEVEPEGISGYGIGGLAGAQASGQAI